MRVKHPKRPRVAFVYDRVNKLGGAERVLLALHELWPEAPLYTAVYEKSTASWAKVFSITSSFLQSIPFAKTHHEWFAVATPMAFESLSFSQYDVVISVTSAEAKNIITNPNTLHICYCLTPTRYLWSGAKDYMNSPHIGLPKWLVRMGMRAFIAMLRSWDLLASKRPDSYIAISNRVKSRIQTYYDRTVERVIYPPVRVEYFSHTVNANPSHPKDYYIIVSRLVGYKKIDIVVDACTRLKLPLVVIGTGVEKKQLMKRAGSTIMFIDSASDEEVRQWLQSCKAFLYAADEDFGIAIAEAQACGKPVLAYRHSGASEIILEGKTGMFFDEQTVESLEKALNRFHHEWYDSGLCRENAARFSTDRFKREMKIQVETLYNREYI